MTETEARPSIGETVYLYDEEERRWATGRIDHFDDSGQWVFILCDDGLMAETWTRDLRSIAPGRWYEENDNTTTRE